MRVFQLVVEENPGERPKIYICTFNPIETVFFFHFLVSFLGGQAGE